MLAALLRFVEPSDGTMRFDGRSSGAETPAAWREHFSWLPQRPHLFNATLGENLRLGAPDASDEELHRVLDAVGLADLLANLPAGLLTAVGHDGLTLSSGERQRVALARALLRPAPVLLLDEPTAALDPPTVALLAPAIEPWLRGRTVVVAAHEPLLLPHFDPVVSGRPPRGGGAVSRPGGALRRVLAEPGTPYGRLALAGLLGLAAAAATIGLLAGSGYVVGRAALRPGLSALVGILAVVEVLAFLRGPLRYAERLVGHDAALRALTRWRLWLYDCLTPRVPAALAGWRSGDLLARAIDDVDALQDLYLRTLLPVAIAAGAAVIGTVAVGLILPWAALALGLPLLVALTVPALLTWRRDGDEEVAALAGTLSAQVVDALAGAPELLAFGADAASLARRRGSRRAERRARAPPRPPRDRDDGAHAGLPGGRGDRGAGCRRVRRARPSPRPGHGGRAAPRRARHLRDRAGRTAGGGPLARGAGRRRAPLRARGRARPRGRPRHPRRRRPASPRSPSPMPPCATTPASPAPSTV